MKISKLLTKIEYLVQSVFYSKDKKCPCCNSSNIETKAKKYKLINVEMCNECNLYFMNPMYKSSFSSSFYDKFYKAEGLTTELPDKQKLSQLMESNFSNSDKDFSSAIALITNLVGNSSILEIGSSWGYFLYQAKKAGLNATGVEISKTRSQYGIDNLNVDIRNSFEDISEKYDLVFTNHVLEHFTDLTDVFSFFNNTLKYNGYFVCAVPNFNFYERQDVISQIGAVHPLGLNKHFFDYILPKNGFKIVSYLDDFDISTDEKHNLVVDSSQIIIIAQKL